MDKEIGLIIMIVLLLIALQWTMIRSLLELASTSHYGTRKNAFVILLGCILCPVIGVTGFFHMEWWLLPLGGILPAVFIAVGGYWMHEELKGYIKYARKQKDSV